MVLEFINTAYPALLIISGIIGGALGLNRAFKKVEEESTKLLAFAVAGSLLMFATMAILLTNKADVTNFTYLFMFLFSLSTIARPLKKIPVAFLIASVAGIGVLYVIVNNAGDLPIIGTASMKQILIAVSVVFIVVFILGFLQERLFDGLLIVIGWGPIIFLLGLSLILQGITLFLKYPDADGFLGLINPWK